MSSGSPRSLSERLPHHLRIALDDAAAADREQRVADEGELVGGEEIRDVARGVAGRVDDAAFEPADPRRVTLADGLIDVRNALCLVARGDDAAFVLLLEFANALGVIGVVMGHQNIGEPPAGFLQRRLDRLRPRVRRSRRSRHFADRAATRRNYLSGRGRGKSVQAIFSPSLRALRQRVTRNS